MVRFRLPSALRDRINADAETRGLTASEVIRQAVERDLLMRVSREVGVSHRGRRWRRLRRCLCCGAFVRQGYTCTKCRLAAAETLADEFGVHVNPYIPRPPYSARPDRRDPHWLEAEGIVLDAYAPIVGIVYEVITGTTSVEMTDLDDIADLLHVAASLRN